MDWREIKSELIDTCRDKLLKDIQKAKEHLETAERLLCGGNLNLLEAATQMEIAGGILDYDNFTLSIFDFVNQMQKY